jgi:hypothetical protein
MNKKKYLIPAFLVIALVGLPVVLSINRQTQDSRSRASASTTLYFTPASAVSSPIQTDPNQTITLDIWINPGSNLVSVVMLDLNFDPSKFQVQPTGFLPNYAALPTTLEGPVHGNGTLKISLSIGSDTTKSISTITKVGTLTLTALPTLDDNPSIISFGQESFVLSVGSEDSANENVLAITEPAIIRIQTPPTPTPNPTRLSITTFLHGIGASGDNANPNDGRLSNKSPLHLQRTATAYVYNSQNQLIASDSGIVIYDQTDGNFKGNINLIQPITNGVYTVKIDLPGHLRRLIPGIQTLSSTSNILPPITLITGDVIDDNSLNILDYNIIVNCYSDLLPPKACNDTNKALADINDDGPVNQVDYNLFLREITVQNGD